MTKRSTLQHKYQNQQGLQPINITIDFGGSTRSLKFSRDYAEKETVAGIRPLNGVITCVNYR